MSNILIEPFEYLNGAPLSKALLRSLPEDFYVVEDLGYEPDGEGEHHYLYIQKRGENTDWVAKQLAHFCQVSPKDVAYAGKKDRHAVTEQWFSVHLPGSRRTLNWDLFGGDTINVLRSSKHRRKIKLGHLRGNRFEILLRDVDNLSDLQARVDCVRNGVPNYFGEQRFGRNFSNLYSGLSMLAGEIQERQRNKRGMYISALRSYVFNRMISGRLSQGCWDSLLEGDVLIEDYTQKVQRYDVQNIEQTALFESLDLHQTAAMWGKGDLYSEGVVEVFEQSIASRFPDITTGLETLGLRQERRSIRLIPRNLEFTLKGENMCRVAFDLPSGSFATSVLRELCSWN